MFRIKDKFMFRLVLVLLITVLLSGGYMLYMKALDRKLEKEQESFRKQGYPVTLQELDRWYPPIPDEENAAMVYSMAFSLLSTQEKHNILLPLEGMTNFPARTEPIPGDIRSEILKYLKKNEDALTLLEQAANLSNSRYPIKFSEGYGTLLPHLSSIRRMARIQSLKVAIHADDQEPVKVVQTLRQMDSIIKSTRNEPLLISYLVRIACSKITKDAVEYSLCRTSFSTNALQEMALLFNEDEDSRQYLRSLGGEYVLFTTINSAESLNYMGSGTGAFGSGPGKRIGYALIFKAYRISGLSRVDQLNHLYHLGLLREFGRENTPADDPAVKSLQAEVSQKPWFYLSKLTLPATVQSHIKHCTSKAVDRTALAAIAIEQFWARNERAPDTLEEMVPEFLSAVPIDPFDGKQLRLKHLTNGYVIYSVGEDLIDNGGLENKPFPGGSHPREYDITFTVEKESPPR